MELEKDIERLVYELNSLHDVDRVAARLIASGAKAIPALERFLLLGKPGFVYEPRRAAVEVLAALGAKDVLIKYLTWKKEINDPATRHAEQAVENAVARELAAFRTDDVLETLLRLAIPHPQPGIVEALGQLECADAIPYFIRALEDDFCQTAAENALKTFGRRAELALASAAQMPLPSKEEERPSSRRRRGRSLQLLAELKPSAEIWPLLRDLLGDSEPSIVVAATRLATRLGNREDRIAAVDRLLSVLSDADWCLRTEIQDCLVGLYPDAASRVAQELAARSALPEAEQATDSSLRTLIGVQRRIEQKSHHLQGGP